MEISPENALLLSMVIRDGVDGTHNCEKLLTDGAKSDLIEIGQQIIGQIMFKTEFGTLRLKNDLLGGIEQN
ncbi:MAG: hypothetical protein ACK4NY_09350 [Spirosomataceae bacterium]